MTAPIRVAVTGAGGQIGYALIFRIAAGDLFGPQQPVALQLLEITPALPSLNGTLMELDDCAFPLLTDVVATDPASPAFGGADGVGFCRSLPLRCGGVAVPGVVFYDGVEAGGPLVRCAGCKRTEVLDEACTRLKSLAK